jgi:hypothetical protein
MEKLKSRYVVGLIDSWFEENTLQFSEFFETKSKSNISSLHPIFDPKKHFYYAFKWSFVVKL